jgi:phage portal protein BeeE
MNIFNRIGNGWAAFTGKGNDLHTRNMKAGYQYYNSNDKERWVTINGQEFMLYNTTAEVKIVFNRFADMFSNGRWVHKKKDGTEKGKVIEDSDFVALLERPNPLQSGEEWKKESALHYLIYGNRFTFPLFASGLSRIPTLINNLPPDHVHVRTTGYRWDQPTIEGIIENYVLQMWGETEYERKFSPDEIIHHRNVDPSDPILGTSVLHSLTMPISNIRGAYGFRNVNITKRGALGFITNKSRDVNGSVSLSVAERLRLEKQQQQQTHGIYDGQNAVMITNDDLAWENTAYPIDKMMLFEEISEDMKKIIDAIGLNDNIFSKEKSKIQANLAEGLKMAYQDAIIPFAESFASTMTSGMRLPDDEWLELDYSHIQVLKDDEKSKAEIQKLKAEAVAKLVASGYSKEQAEKVIVF